MRMNHSPHMVNAWNEQWASIASLHAIKAKEPHGPKIALVVIRDWFVVGPDHAAMFSLERQPSEETTVRLERSKR